MVPLTDSQAIIHEYAPTPVNSSGIEIIRTLYIQYVCSPLAPRAYCRVPPTRRCYFSATVLVPKLQNPSNHTETGVPQRLGFYVVEVGGGLYIDTSVTSRVLLFLDQIFKDYLHMYVYAQRLDDFLTFPVPWNNSQISVMMSSAHPKAVKTYKLVVERHGRCLQGVALTAETATN